jgi:hypothetical protein
MLHPPRLSRKAWEIRRFPFLSHCVLGYNRIVEESPTIRPESSDSPQVGGFSPPQKIRFCLSSVRSPTKPRLTVWATAPNAKTAPCRAALNFTSPQRLLRKRVFALALIRHAVGGSAARAGTLSLYALQLACASHELPLVCGDLYLTILRTGG